MYADYMTLWIVNTHYAAKTLLQRHSDNNNNWLSIYSMRPNEI